MNGTPTPFDDETLGAFVDGELAEPERAEVQVWLAENEDAAADVEAWRAQKQALHAGFDSVLDEALPDAIVALVHRRRVGFSLPGWLAAAASVALFVAGAAAGWVVHDVRGTDEANADDLVRRAVGAHVVYVPEVRHPVEVASSEEAHLVAWLSKRLGQAVRVPDLASAGFQLVGGRLLPHAGAPAAQFMYENAGGDRVTLYIRTGRAGRDTAFRFASESGVSAFYWIDGPMGYAVSAKMPRQGLLEIARMVYEGL
ncbi:MAG TPA: anti-sigma factor [Rhodospirillales bacterium]|nr:anti-sigma factor [Rhodospirillales bacterium]